MANEAGAGCVDRASSTSSYTWVSEGAPASTTGSCNKLESYCAVAEVTDVFKFNFFTASGDNLTAIGSAISIAAGSIGTQCYSFSAPGDFTAFSVNSGEYLGVYSTEAIKYSSSGGSGLWYYSGDGSGANGLGFTLMADGIDGLNADITAAGGPVMAVFDYYYNQARL